MKNNKVNFIFSLILTLLLVLGFYGVSSLDVHASEGHTHNDIEFIEWTSTDSLPPTSGSYYLANDVILSETWEVPDDGTLNLCLNGNVISLAPSEDDLEDAIVLFDGCELNIYDCNNEKENYFKDTNFYYNLDDRVYWEHDDSLTGDDIKHTVKGGVITGTLYRGISLFGGATLNMYGGTICHSSSNYNYGGAVMIFGGTFNMYDGASLTDNDGPMGGAVFLYTVDNDNPAVFNMYGGKISNNYAESDGGGVCIATDAIFNFYDGEISHNSAYRGGGIAALSDSTLNMYGGLVTENTATLGGGICVGEFNSDGTAYIHGGEISNNKAVHDEEALSYGDKPGGAGGGIYLYDGYVLKIDGGVIKDNDADFAGGGVYISMSGLEDPYYCVAEGTLVTVDDDTFVPVEELKVGDTVRVFDHEAGTLSTSTIYYLEKSEDVDYGVVTLHFTDNIDITIVGGHSFYCRDENKYVTLADYNAGDYIGKEFYNADTGSYVTLASFDYVNDPINSYSIVTSGAINLVTNHMLSCGDALYTVLVNIFDFDEDLKHDPVAKDNDIATFGLYTFDEMNYATKESFDALNLQYLKVALGKNLLSKDELIYAAQYQQWNNSGLVDSRFLYLGGTVQIYDNLIKLSEKNDVQVWISELSSKIAIGEGEEENGCKVPEDGMRVGVVVMRYNDDPTSPISEFGVFSTNGTKEDVKYFFSDVSWAVPYYSDGHLELKNLPVPIPTPEVTTFVYDEETKTFDVPTSAYYTITGAVEGLEPGIYNVSLSLRDKEANRWDNETTDDVTLTFTIYQRASDVVVVYEGESESPVLIIEAEDGIEPDAVLVVQVVSIESEEDIETSISALERENKIAENEELFGLYDAKLLLNNVEIQPNGNIKIKMLVPDELKGKEFKLYHIHAGNEVYEVSYTDVDEDGYLTFITNKLSQFAFIGEVEQPPIEPPVEPAGDKCIIHWFLIGVLVIGIAVNVLLYFFLNKKLINIIIPCVCLVASIVLGILGKCNICIIFLIINILIFALMLLYVLLKDKKNDKEEKEDKEDSEEK